MKIIQINAVYEYSSTGRTTKEMHLALKDRGIDSYVFCTNKSIPEDKVFLIGSKLDYKLHAALSRILGLQGYFSHFATNKLLKQLKAIQPDVVILRNLHANYINVPKLCEFLAKNNIPTIDVLHDCWSYTGHCCYYTEDGCDKWQTECNHCPILHKYNTSLFFDNSTRIFRMKKSGFGKLKNLAVIGVSKWIANEGRLSPIFANAKIIKHIYNWISLDIFYPRQTVELRKKLGIEKDDFIVLGVSQKWSDYKGLNHFITIANKIPDVKILMVGYMPDGVILPDNVISVPPVSSPDELATYYSLGDVFLNFSIQETFGKVTAEALACGTPLIVNNATANPELCGNGCGFVIDNNDHDQMIKAIKTIRKNGKSAYSNRCRSFAQDNFDKEKGINNYVALFSEMIKNKSK